MSSTPSRRAGVTTAPFEDVVQVHGAMVLRICRAMLGPIDADDAWSETFVSALRAYPRLDADANVAAWLTTIAHRKAIDRIRTRRRHAAPSGDLDEVAAAVAATRPDRAVHEWPTGAVIDHDLLAAVDALAPKQRGAVVYHYLADLPYGEVAEILGTSEAAARRSAADGIAKLRARHRRDHDDE